jgi:hypothetical protein
MTEKSWVHYLCFDAYFEDALMKYRASTGLGATYALFNLLNEKLYELGFMDETGYHYHKERYGLPLVDEFEKQLQMRDKTARLEIQQRRLEIEKLTKRLTNVFNEWAIMKAEARAYYLNIAKENPDLPIAQEILKVASNEG